MSTVFKKIIDREIPAYILYEDDDVLAFLDISQATKGHALVIPKEETVSFLTASDAIISKVNVVARKVALELMDVFKAQGFNILSNVNEVAGQSVFHYHVHVIPRYTKDELVFEPKPNAYDAKEVHEQFKNHEKNGL